MEKVGVLSALSEIEHIWGKQEDKTRTTSERKLVVYKKLSSAYHRSVSDTSSRVEVSFIFSFESDPAVKVCENSYLCTIAHPYSTMWKRAKKLVTQEMSTGNHNKMMSKDAVQKLIDSKKPVSEKKSRIKFDHCQKFITWYAKTYGSESPNTDEEDLKIIPFEGISQLYMEYQMSCKYDNLHPGEFAMKETFRKAWVDLHKKKQVRFVRGKGTFPTCDICNNANDMLSSATKKYTKAQREIIVSYLVLLFITYLLASTYNNYYFH
jgi:hypothetical protein